MKDRYKKRTVVTSIIIKNVPVALRDHFKAWAALHGVSMKEVFVAFMREKIQQRKD